MGQVSTAMPTGFAEIRVTWESFVTHKDKAGEGARVPSDRQGGRGRPRSQ